MTRRRPPEGVPPPGSAMNEPRLGQPGYRLRHGRTGLDPVDSAAELGRAEGLFLKRLFTGSLRTQDPAQRWAMGCAGTMGVVTGGLFALFALADLAQFEASLCFAPILLVGSLLLLNLALCWRDDADQRRYERDRASWRRERWRSP